MPIPDLEDVRDKLRTTQSKTIFDCIYYIYKKIYNPPKKIYNPPTGMSIFIQEEFACLLPLFMRVVLSGRVTSNE